MFGESSKGPEQTLLMTENKKRYDCRIAGKLSTLTMSVWDTPGGDHFAKINEDDYRNVDAVILVYSIDKESTYDKISDLHERIISISRST